MKRPLVILAVVILIMNIANALAEVSYRTVRVDDLDIFYREAGPKDGPAILLLHGLPSSSRMYQPLLESDLANQYHLVAPDYPGFGHSSWPDPKSFAYTFDHLAQIIEDFTEQLHLEHYTLFMQDYGGPVGFRMALAHPERVQAMIIQNAVSHEEGLSPLWAVRRAFWEDQPAHEAEVRNNLLSLEATRKRHVGTSPDLAQYNPDLWVDEYYFLNQPGQGGYSVGSLLRLSKQPQVLPEMATVASRQQAAGCHRRCSDCKSGTAETGRECSRTRKEPAGWISYDNEGHLHKIVLQNKSVAAYGMQCRKPHIRKCQAQRSLSTRMPRLRPPVLSSASTMPSSAGPIGLIFRS
jgi:pimeloyl-ACP methyl ester carboxylesterase